MKNPVQAIAEDMSYGSKPSVWVYLGVSLWLFFMLAAAVVVTGLITVGIYTSLPWSLLPTGVFFAVLGFGWYTWYRNSRESEWKVRVKK